MRRFSLVDSETGRCLLPEVEAAESLPRRVAGLMGRRFLKAGAGLYIPRCSSIHMFFMRFPIDVVYLDREKRVRKVVHALKPWRLSWCPGADSVLEAPAGWAAQVALREGMQLLLDRRVEALP